MLSAPYRKRYYKNHAVAAKVAALLKRGLEEELFAVAALAHPTVAVLAAALVCDAWFDVMTSDGSDRWFAVGLALFAVPAGSVLTLALSVPIGWPCYQRLHGEARRLARFREAQAEGLVQRDDALVAVWCIAQVHSLGYRRGGGGLDCRRSIYRVRV